MSFSIMTTSELRIYTHTSLETQRRTFFSAVCFFFLDRRRGCVMLSCEA